MFAGKGVLPGDYIYCIYCKKDEDRNSVCVTSYRFFKKGEQKGMPDKEEILQAARVQEFEVHPSQRCCMHARQPCILFVKRRDGHASAICMIQRRKKGVIDVM